MRGQNILRKHKELYINILDPQELELGWLERGLEEARFGVGKAKREGVIKGRTPKVDNKEEGEVDQHRGAAGDVQWEGVEAELEGVVAVREEEVGGGQAEEGGED